MAGFANRAQCLDKLTTALSAIAEGRNLKDRKLQAQILRNKLVRAIEFYRNRIAAERHYASFVEPWEREQQRPDGWLCYLIRLTSNKRSISRRHGSKPLGNLKSAIENAKTARNVMQLSPVEQRAFEILKGKRLGSKKHPIERRAILLAKAVEAGGWFLVHRPGGRPTGTWLRKRKNKGDRSFGALKPLLTISDVILILAPIIETFAGCKIRLRSEAFDALYHAICAYSDLVQRNTPGRDLSISRNAVYQALRRARPELARRERIALDIARRHLLRILNLLPILRKQCARTT
jgi:hypothetical protein